MKHLLTLIISLMTLGLFGQDNLEPLANHASLYSENSEIVVIYKDSLKQIHSGNEPVSYFVNGRFVNETILATLDTEKIESINLDKVKYERNGVRYFGKINIVLKPGCNPNFITLMEFANKYLRLDSDPRIFQIDEHVIGEKYKEYIVDENSILKIEVSKVRTSDNGTELNLIKLITRAAKNIEKANEIRIKGTEK